MIKLTIVCPCYNEEQVLPLSAGRLKDLMGSLMSAGKISDDSCVLFVNDGSRDTTWNIIRNLHGENPMFRGLNLAHNVGHQYAILAGMMSAREWSDAVITMDADLQDDLGCIEKMVDAYHEGYDVVYGVKVSREADPLLKRMTAQYFYRLQRKMGVDSVYNHADFRFLSRRVLDALSGFKERNIYLRGMIPMIGFPSTTVADVISERQAGVSKYTLRKMFNLALDGITSFSVKPLLAVITMGLVFILISLGILVYVLYSIFAHTAVAGWASLMLSVWFVGGVVLVAIGIVGVYVGKIYTESKGRPRYIIQDIL